MMNSGDLEGVRKIGRDPVGAAIYRRPVVVAGMERRACLRYSSRTSTRIRRCGDVWPRPPGSPTPPRVPRGTPPGPGGGRKKGGPGDRELSPDGGALASLLAS